MQRADGEGASAQSDRATLDHDGGEPPLKNLISRKETCTLLNLSRSGVRRLDGVWFTGILVGRVVHYPRAEVDRYIQARDGSNAGPCFDAFNEGRSPNYVIAKLGIDPAIVERYYKFFLKNRTQETHVFVVELAHNVNSALWFRTMGFGDKAPHSTYIRLALEHAAMTPALHKRFMRAVDDQRRASEANDDEHEPDDDESDE